MTTELAAEYAVRIWTRRHSGTWAESDEVELQAWLAAAPEHSAAYDRVARLWSAAGGLGGYFSRGGVATRRPRRRRAVAVVGVAAALVTCAIALGYVGYNRWRGAPEQWTAGRDKPTEFVLGDGTRVLLDAGSEVVTNLGWRTRRVSLRRGEALFTVAHDASRPFEVEAGAGRLTDLGTRFDVETVGGSTQVAVLEGRVGVSTARGTVELTAGHGGGYDAHGSLLPLRAIDNSATLWSEGRRRFAAEPLPVVLERLTRYHDVSFVFSEPRLRELRVSGTFRVDDLHLFLRTLGAALPLDARWVDPQHVEIRPRPDTAGGPAAESVGSGRSR